MPGPGPGLGLGPGPGPAADCGRVSARMRALCSRAVLPVRGIT